ncbi:MAG: ribonuclease Y [Candidatus Nomurabacteria bacterium]|nr:ribonuclease Y [Candidatus Nomurabacteria bacterium]
MSPIIIAVITAVVGVLLGYLARIVVATYQKKNIDIAVREAMVRAKADAQSITDKAEAKAEKLLTEAKAEATQRHDEAKQTEERLVKKENLLDTRQAEFDTKEANLKQNIEEVKEIKESISKMKDSKLAELEKIAGLSSGEARETLLKDVKNKYADDLTARMQKLEIGNKETLDKRAKEILSTTIQRYANASINDIMTTHVPIPSDDVKGKIIGKEGRNIKAFERAAGVEVLIDDTPNAITISAYDPVRRQVARIAMENLILDGRIQPARIEEFVEKAKNDLNTIVKKKGEEAVYELGILNLDPRIVAIIGRLYFRSSYGQNVLQHSVEMGHVAGMLAEQLGADPYIAKAGALVHDIGKALDHEVQGSHVEIGMRILRKFGADEAIVTAMKSHHEEYPYESLEAVIVQTADAISGGRPGARRDSVEQYLKRLEDLEAVATGFEGVNSAYALQAGREIRVFVSPEKTTDLQAKEMARNIAVQIEKDLKYPGEIKVTLIRENRITEFAR